MKQCNKCGRYIDDQTSFCPNCGFPQPPPYNGYQNYQQYAGANTPPSRSDNCFNEGPEGKSRGIAAIFAIVFGSIGLQYFYVGKIPAGFITIALEIVTCGAWTIVNVIQGILMFCMTNEQFRQKYLLSDSTFPLF